MASNEVLQRGLDLGREFVRGVVDRDADALAALFAEGAVFRAVVPNEARPFREKNGGAEAAEQLHAWFEDADVIGCSTARSRLSPIASRSAIACASTSPTAGWRWSSRPTPSRRPRASYACNSPAPASDRWPHQTAAEEA
jgi:hypothetical protein